MFKEILQNYYATQCSSIITTFIFFSTIYFFFAGIAYCIEISINKPVHSGVKNGQIFNEVVKSLQTISIFSLGFLVVWYGLRYKIFSINFKFSFVAFCELIILILWNDVHFYFSHRLLHKVKLLKKYHSVHHKFRPSTPFAAFAFHPVEAIILGSVLPIALLFHEFSAFSLIFLPIWSIIINTLSHANIKNLSLSQHHQDHHFYYQGNYGFFFQGLDKLFKSYINTHAINIEPAINT